MEMGEEHVELATGFLVAGEGIERCAGKHAIEQLTSEMTDTRAGIENDQRTAVRFDPDTGRVAAIGSDDGWGKTFKVGSNAFFIRLFPEELRGAAISKQSHEESNLLVKDLLR